MEGQIAFKRQRVTFPEVEDEPQFKEVWFHFPATVWTADCAINGFNIGFTRSDRELHWLNVDTHMGVIQNSSVKVRVDFGLRDKSGYYDDPYRGYVDVLVIAHCNE
ncbi:hypothetical protein [Nocardia abscessus]|uniref:hypothetical protein n=1 Tax=Nocardia abscessus TaxID=120957 RepID=UPI0024554FE0|nr:hypothetical protein [Nocardia abscessus]